MNPFRKFKAALELREAIKKANNAHANTGERFFVMPYIDGRLVVMDRKNFRKLRFKGYINRGVYVNDLLLDSFYFTPCRSGNMPMSESLRKNKVKRFFEWKELLLKKKKAQRRRAIKQKIAKFKAIFIRKKA